MTKFISFRTTPNIEIMLRTLRKRYGWNESESIRRCINIYYAELKEQTQNDN